MVSEQQHTAILEMFYFRYIDRGTAPEDTPLFQHIAGKESLTRIIQLAYAQDESSSEDCLKSAYEEVKLP